MKIIVCGGRTFDDERALRESLDELLYLQAIELVAHGAATGADTLAMHWANDRKIPHRPYRALWSQHGKNAGPIRNAVMLKYVSPDMVVAFPGGKGTADMVHKAEAAGVVVWKPLEGEGKIKFSVLTRMPGGQEEWERFEKWPGERRSIRGHGEQPVFDGRPEVWGRAIIDWFNKDEPPERHRAFVRAVAGWPEGQE